MIVRTCLALAVTFAVSLAASGQEKSGEKGEKFKNVKPEEFEKLSKEPNAVILDVRTAEEYKSGHIPKSVNIDIKSPDFAKKIESLDKNKTYLVHCAGGGRGKMACQKLAELSIPALYNLDGGIRAWEKAGKPVEK